MGIKETTLEVLSAILPITAIITLLQFTFVKLPMEVFYEFIGGSIMVTLGLIFFLLGVKIGFLPMGEMTAAKIVTKGNLWLILLFGFVLGFAVTIAEPDLQVLASQVASVSDGQIPKNILLISVALGVGIFCLLGLLRMFLNVPIIYLLLGGYGLIFLLAALAPPQYMAVSFDAGGVTTGPMTVPFILALGVGIASSIKRKGTTVDSFGLVALASVGPILAVLLLGVIYQ